MTLQFLQRVDTPNGKGLWIGYLGMSTCLVAMKIPASTMSDEEIMSRKAILRILDQHKLSQALKDARASSHFQINYIFNISEVKPAI